MTSNEPKTASGQRLADFLPLTPAEEILREACQQGEVALIGSGKRPEDNNPALCVRANVLRVFCLGLDRDAAVHPRGIRLCGARITGDLDLDGCATPKPITLAACNIDGDVRFFDGTAKQLSLAGSRVNGIFADRFRCDGGVFLRYGFISKQQVRFPGATIGGDFSCTAGLLEYSNGTALLLDGATISGAVFLDSGFISKGEVRVTGAIIGGSLQCSKGSFEATEGNSINLDSTAISGDVFLRDGFIANRQVRLRNARIGGSLECWGGNFLETQAFSLAMDGASVAESVFLSDGFIATSAISFVGAKIGGIVDDQQSWEGRTLLLDGFTWQRFGGKASTDAASRIRWLDRQPRPHLTTDFRPQPWEQCAKVLAEMGHEREATKIRIEKRKRMRMLDWRRSKSVWQKAKRVPSIIFDFILCLTVAYGYRPLLAGLWLLGLWIAASLAFTSLVPPTVMTPTDARVYLASTIPDACRDDWVSFTPPPRPTDAPQRIRWSETFRLPIDDRGGSPVPAPWRDICNRAMPSEYTTFSPWVYTLDLLLPIVDLRQEKDWAPRVTDANGDVLSPLWSGASIGLGHVTRFAEWTLILLGWILSALLIGAVTGIIRRD